MILLLLHLDGLGSGLTHVISARPDHGGQGIPREKEQLFRFRCRCAGVLECYALKSAKAHIKAQTLSGAQRAPLEPVPPSRSCVKAIAC